MRIRFCFCRFMTNIPVHALKWCVRPGWHGAQGAFVLCHLPRPEFVVRPGLYIPWASDFVFVGSSKKRARGHAYKKGCAAGMNWIPACFAFCLLLWPGRGRAWTSGRGRHFVVFHAHQYILDFVFVVCQKNARRATSIKGVRPG